MSNWNSSAKKIVLAFVAFMALGTGIWVLWKRERTPEQAPLMPTPPIASTASTPEKKPTTEPALFRFEPQLEQPARIAPRTSPISLTASDGTGLRLISLDARGVIEEPLAFTELHLVFENPEPRTIEANFKIALPEGASVSRFAMKIGGQWQEGEVVELQRARQTYEDFLHRKQDPALLEQSSGNEFTARVFPIPARSRKELIVSFSHELVRADQPYALTLVGLPEIARVSARVQVASDGKTQHVVELQETTWTPDRNFEVPLGDERTRLGLRHENLVVARVTPVLTSQPERLDSMLFLIDTSASRALGFEDQLALLSRLIEALQRGGGKQLPIAVAAFDQDVELMFEGKAEGFNTDVVDRLKFRSALGASDLAGALSWVAKRTGPRYSRIVMLTDGVATAGAIEGEQVLAALRALRTAEVERLDAIVFGGIRDTALLSRLVTQGLPSAGTVIESTASDAELARKLTERARSGIEVAVRGASWTWPERLDGVQAGDQVLVYADLPASEQFSMTLGGEEINTADRRLASAERPLLERAWVKARIAKLLALRESAQGRDEDLRSALARQVVDISTKNRVLSPFTGFLVLETEWDYARYQIDRRALANIMTVGAQGITIARRADAPVIGGGSLALRESRASRPTPVTRRPELGDETIDDLGGGGSSGVALKAEPRKDGARSAASLQSEPESEPEPEPELQRSAQPNAGAGPSRLDPPQRSFDKADRDAPAAEAAFDGVEKSGKTSDAPADDALLEGGVIAESKPTASRSRRTPPPLDRQLGRRPPPFRPRSAIRRKPYNGDLENVMNELSRGDLEAAHAKARAWRARSPDDLLALVALGETLELRGDRPKAARAYGSLIDLFPSRADIRRFAGSRLERIKTAEALAVALDSFEKAVAQRPDHPTSHRLLAFALLKSGAHERAFEAILIGLTRNYPWGRFAGATNVLRADLGLIAAAWIREQPARESEIRQRLLAAGVAVESERSLRFVLSWESDSNDVDLFVHDPSGARVARVNDVITGYGPESVAIKNPSGPYAIKVHYYSRGPMGYGMGKVEVVEHDGRGGVSFDERPFVIMNDSGFIELGTR